MSPLVANTSFAMPDLLVGAPVPTGLGPNDSWWACPSVVAVAVPGQVQNTGVVVDVLSVLCLWGG